MNKEKRKNMVIIVRNIQMQKQKKTKSACKITKC